MSLFFAVYIRIKCLEHVSFEANDFCCVIHVIDIPVNIQGDDILENYGNTPLTTQ